MITPEQRAARLLKVERLREGHRLRALEACSGCGGLALGMKSAGFDLTAHIEMDALAAATYALNFGGDRPSDDPWALARDMVATSAQGLISDLGLETEAPVAFDVLAAGLPCQAFARIGRSKLREVSGGADDAYIRDPRAGLYRRFLHFVAETQPLAIIIENVPDILNFGGHNVPEEICDTLEKSGYRTRYTILNAAYYGVPQVRERLFLIALADELQIVPDFPAPTHFFELPRGYESSRSVALKHVAPDSKRYQAIQVPEKTLPPAVRVREALADLPWIREHWSDPTAMRRRAVQDSLAYRDVKDLSDYAKLMKDWPGFGTDGAVDGNVVRRTPRDFPIFQLMPHGADYPQAREIAETRFEWEAVQRGLRAADAEARLELWEEMVPPYDPSKFPNKWWKMDPDRPSRTLTAHIGKDTYSHIHHDSRQKRTISVREAARLQSFPDGFRFSGAMNAAFRQIGNAVPPLLAKAVAEHLKKIVSAAAVLPKNVVRNREAA